MKQSGSYHHNNPFPTVLICPSAWDITLLAPQILRKSDKLLVCHMYAIMMAFNTIPNKKVLYVILHINIQAIRGSSPPPLAFHHGGNFNGKRAVILHIPDIEIDLR